MDSLLCVLSDDSPQEITEEAQYNEPSVFFKNEIEMLLSSRIRFSSIEELALVNRSVVNYGINEPISLTFDLSQTTKDLNLQIETSLRRFEPRLKHVVIQICKQNLVDVTFQIEAKYQETPLIFILTWNYLLGRFYFHE